MSLKFGRQPIKIDCPMWVCGMRVPLFVCFDYGAAISAFISRSMIIDRGLADLFLLAVGTFVQYVSET